MSWVTKCTKDFYPEDEMRTPRTWCIQVLNEYELKWKPLSDVRDIVAGYNNEIDQFSLNGSKTKQIPLLQGIIA